MSTSGEAGRAAALAWLRNPQTLARMQVEPLVGAQWRWSDDEPGAGEGLDEAFEHFRQLGVFAGSSSSVARCREGTTTYSREAVVEWAEVPALLDAAPFLAERVGPIPSPLPPAPSWPPTDLPHPVDES